jgi:iron complex transport system substrate-binding protein
MLASNIERMAEGARLLSRRPRVFFEEWHEPLISGIRWVSELLEVAGGDDVCAESRDSPLAKGRIYAPEEVARRNPELVIASWCGRKARREQMVARPGWDAVRAVQDDQLYEVKSSLILQPGPAALTDGLTQLATIIGAWADGRLLPARRPGELRSAPS